jgi:hypothetical protein
MHVLTKEQIALNLVGLAMLMALAAWWYWQSTGVQAVPELIEQLHDPDPSTRIIAADWLGTIGPKATAAVPSLLVLATQDSVQHANTTAAAALRHIDLAAARHVMAHYIPLLSRGDIQSRRTAGAIIGELGPVARPAVPCSSPSRTTRTNWSGEMRSPPWEILGFLPVKFPRPYSRVYATHPLWSAKPPPHNSPLRFHFRQSGLMRSGRCSTNRMPP